MTNFPVWWMKRAAEEALVIGVSLLAIQTGDEGDSYLEFQMAKYVLLVVSKGVTNPKVKFLLLETNRPVKLRVSD